MPLPSKSATSSYLVSCAKSNKLFIQSLMIEEAITNWQAMSGSTEIPDHPMKQKSWQNPVNFLNDGKQRDHFLPVSAKGSSDWLQAIPSTNLSLRMDDRQFQIKVGLRLGASVCSPYTCKCGTQSDSEENHALTSSKIKSRHTRHRYANKVIKQAMSAAEIPSELEPFGLCLSNAKRPDGKTLLPW